MTEGPAVNEDLIIIVLLAIMIFLFLSNFRICGPVGNAISGFFFGLFGFPNYIIPVFVFGVGTWYLLSQDEDKIPKLVSMILLLLAFGIACELISGDLKETVGYHIGEIYARCRDGHNGGGIIAGSAAFLLYHFLKQAGTILILIMLILVSALILSGKSVVEMMESSRREGFDAQPAKRNRYEEDQDEEPEDSEEDAEEESSYDESDGEDNRRREDETRRRDRRPDRDSARASYPDDRSEHEYSNGRERRGRDRYSADDDDTYDEDERYRRIRDEERDSLRRARREREEERRKERENQERRAREEERRRKEEESAKKNEKESEEILRRADSYNLSDATIVKDEKTEDGPAIQSPTDFTGGLASGMAEASSAAAMAGAFAAAGASASKSTNMGAAAEAAAIAADQMDLSSENAADAGTLQKENDARTDGPAPNEGAESDSAPGYSVAEELHEITVKDADYSPITARADLQESLEAPIDRGEYSGIAVPTPAETAPDYTSDNFSNQVIRQGLKETLNYQENIQTAPSSSDGTASSSAVHPVSVRLHEIHPEETEKTADEGNLTGGESETVEAPESGKTAQAGESFDSNEALDRKESPESMEHPDGNIYPEMQKVSAADTVDGIDNSNDRETKKGEGIKDASEPTEKDLDNIQVERERSEEDQAGGAPGNRISSSGLSSGASAEGQSAASAENGPASGGAAFRNNTSGSVFGGGIAAAEKKREEEDEKARAYRAPYVFPPITLLKEGSKKDTGESDRELKETAYRLQSTLKTFGVDVTIPQVSRGPAVTRYELLPAQGVKVSKIVSLADDIKLNLAAADIRIEAPIPGKQAIGIEVPNKSPQTVTLRELFESDIYKSFKAKIKFAVGRDIGGNIVVTDITKMPHVLIAGSTGSGKSVCINTLIMSILFSYKPDEVKMIMIDPKIVELSVYNGIPHLLLPVVTDPKKAANALQWAVAEMTDRYRRFADTSVRDLKGYNEKAAKSNDPDMKVMPQIVIIVDELADLMMVSAHEVEQAICRLAQLARAAGIHLVIATQRPSVDVITGLIKANMPSRIAFAVTSGVDSRTILDMNGAEKLLGKGDMLFYPQGYQKPARVQGAFVSDDEVTDVVNYIKYHNKTWVDSGDVEKKIAAMSASEESDAGGAVVGGGGGDSSYDEHFVEAGYLIIDKQKASIGMLQRVYKIGFNRAARIMDQLCEAGVVSEDEGTKARKVLMTKSDFDSYIEENGI